MLRPVSPGLGDLGSDDITRDLSSHIVALLLLTIY